MPDLPAAYDGVRRSITGLVRDAGPEVVQRRVPACPDWSISDVVGHLEHIAEEFSDGRHPYSTNDVEAMASSWAQDRPGVDAWANAGVATRRGWSIDTLLAAWERQCERLYEMMRGDVDLPAGASHEYLAWAAVFDAATHYQDIRGALGVGPDPDDYATKLAYALCSDTLVRRSAALHPQPPALRVTTQRGEVLIGQGHPVEIELEWFELLRTISGRRSVEQVSELLDPVDAEPYLEAFQMYAYPTGPLEV